MTRGTIRSLTLSQAFKRARGSPFLGRTSRLDWLRVITDYQGLRSTSRKRKCSLHMDPNNAGKVQYDRWNEDNINMNVEASQTTMQRLHNRLCVGTMGIVVKAAGALSAMVAIYIIGYVTGYYVHRC